MAISPLRLFPSGVDVEINPSFKVRLPSSTVILTSPPLPKPSELTLVKIDESSIVIKSLAWRVKLPAFPIPLPIFSTPSLFKRRLELASVILGESIVISPLIPAPPASMIARKETSLELSTFSEA